MSVIPRHAGSSPPAPLWWVLLFLASASLLAPPVSAAPQPGLQAQQFRNRAEYDLATSAYTQSDLHKKLNLLNEWSLSFPNSMFRQERFNEIIVTQQALGMGQEMLQTARQMAADDPNGVGNYWVTVLTVTLQQSSPAGLDRGRLAASALLRNLKTTFALSKKPNSVSEADWFRERDRQKVLAERTLGWVALQQKSWEESVWRLRSVLRSSPNDAEVSFWLGVALLGTGQPNSQPDALYQFARSLVVTGRGALTPAARALVEPYFQTSYAVLYGNNSGAARLLAQAKASPFPAGR